MATRTAYDAVAGTALTATNVDKLAGGWIGYAQVTSNLGGYTTPAADLTGLTLTVTANSNRYHKVSFKVEVSSSVTNDVAEVLITDGGGTQINRGAAACVTGVLSLVGMTVETGWSGSTTRKLRMNRASGTGTLQMSASATTPAFILIEDMGSA